MSEKYISHYGVPGMRWGHRQSVARTQDILGKTETTYRNEANKFKTKREVATTYGDKGSLKRAERYKQGEKFDRQMAQGINKARKLVKGMDKKQAISTLENAAGYSKGQKILNKLFLSGTTRLTISAMDYALNGIKP